MWARKKARQSAEQVGPLCTPAEEGRRPPRGVRLETIKVQAQEFKKKRWRVYCSGMEMHRTGHSSANTKECPGTPQWPVAMPTHFSMHKARAANKKRTKEKSATWHPPCACYASMHARPAVSCRPLARQPTRAVRTSNSLPPNVKTPLPPATAGSPEDRVPAFRPAPLLASGRLASHLPPLWLCWLLTHASTQEDMAFKDVAKARDQRGAARAGLQHACAGGCGGSSGSTWQAERRVLKSRDACQDPAGKKAARKQHQKSHLSCAVACSNRTGMPTTPGSPSVLPTLDLGASSGTAQRDSTMLHPLPLCKRAPTAP